MPPDINHPIPPNKDASIVPHFMSQNVKRIVRYKLDNARYAARIVIKGGRRVWAFHVEGEVASDRSVDARASELERTLNRTEYTGGGKAAWM